MFDLDHQFHGGTPGLGRQRRVHEHAAFRLAARAGAVAMGGKRLAGGLQPALIEEAGNVGLAEGVLANIVDEGHQGVALTARQRDVGNVVDRALGPHHVIDQQERGLFLGHLDPATRRGAVTIAHDPASVGTANRGFPEGFEPLDEFAGRWR